MSKSFKIGLLILSVIFCLNSSSVMAISKVAKQYSFLEFHGGYSHPLGSYESIGIEGYGIHFLNSSGRVFELDAKDVYDGSYNFGFNYGQIQGGHWMFMLGFNFTEIKHEDTFFVDDMMYWFDDTFESPKFRLYDLNLNLNYHFIDPTIMGLSPFVGAGFKAGFLNASIPGFESENEIKFSLGINFGADITLWKNTDNDSFIALSSTNQFQFLNSSERPKYLNVGGAIKYYFRP